MYNSKIKSKKKIVFDFINNHTSLYLDYIILRNKVICNW